MTAYQNPFYSRASEQLRDGFRFIQSFGAGAIDLLPEAAWDRLIVLRSSPGFGKTSLMRLFTEEALARAALLPRAEPVLKELTDRGVIADGEPTKLGVLLGLERDYLSLLDLGESEEAADRLLFRLLDVRIMLAVMRAALSRAGREFPRDIARFELRSREEDPSIDAACERLGGPHGPGIHEYARQTERHLLGLLDAVTIAAGNPEAGHHELLSLRVLSGADIFVDGEQIMGQPLVMLDDGQALHPRQREVLLARLADRKLTVARWYAERYEALSNQELLGAIGLDGRDFELVDLESIARNGTADGRRFREGRYERVLDDIARRRAGPALDRFAHESRDFFELLDDDRSKVLGGDEAQILHTLRERVTRAAQDDPAYNEWIASAERLGGYPAAVRWRELEILISRDRNRQLDVFAEPLTLEEAKQRSSAQIREAASLSVTTEFKLPYYGGPEMVAKLGSHNAEQFLDLCGDLFAEMLVDITVGRSPVLSVQRQDRVLRDASRRYWEQIPERVPNGREVQLLVERIVRMAAADNRKPTVPYPPGVTGTALLMSERDLLLDPARRSTDPTLTRLFSAMAAAVSRNILAAQLNYSVKNNRYMVLYLNRLLCPYFNLPLGYGSFRERRLSAMADWMSGATPSTVEEEQLPL